MDARRRILAPLALALTLLLATACAPTPDPGLTPEPMPIEEPGGPAAGLRLAPGLYDQADGTVLAIGTLAYRDLEGGFWAVLDGTKPAGDANEIVAVIANGEAFSAELEALEGRTADVTGRRLEGASIRMAGPEIEMTGIEEISDTGTVAE